MNVADLIERLQQFPPDLTVTVDGYEGGVTEKVDVGAFYVEPNRYEGEHYVGEHAPITLHPDEETIDDYPHRMLVLNIGSRGTKDYAAKPESITAP